MSEDGKESSAQLKRQLHQERQEGLEREQELIQQIVDLNAKINAFEAPQDSSSRKSSASTVLTEQPRSSSSNTNSEDPKMDSNFLVHQYDIEKYYGHESDQPFSEWFMTLKEVQALKNYSDSQTFRRAILSLRGDAAAAVRNNRDKINNLAELERFLSRRYYFC